MAEAEFAFSPALERIRPSASGAASQRARELTSLGRNVISLTVGEPDFPTPLHIREAAVRALHAGQTRYTNADGTPELKEAICHKFARENGLDYHPDQITVANGAKQIIFNALVATLQPGDEVIVPGPYWVSYPEIVRFTGATPVFVLGRATTGHKIGPEELEAAITPRTKWLILNSPSNPTGATYSPAEMRALTSVLLRYPYVWILSDDIYEHLNYDDSVFCTPAAVCPGLKDRTLTVNGVSKAYAMTGWRIGYAAGPPALIRRMAILQSQSTSNPCSISQAAAVEALNGPQAAVQEYVSIFKRRLDLMMALLHDIPMLSVARPQGAFYLYPSCARAIGLKTPAGGLISSDEDLTLYLLDAGVAVVQGAAYGVSPHLRLSFAASDSDLIEACVRIRTACEALS